MFSKFINKAKQEQREYAKKVRRLFVETFGLSENDLAEQDRVWSQWLALKEQEWRDLRGLLKGDVKDAFKARALTVLLAPDFFCVSLLWPKGKANENFLCLGERIALKGLSPQLRSLALVLLELNISRVLLHPADKNLQETLFQCNSLILQALALLPEDSVRAARLFGLYQLNDPIPYYNMDEASGYNPFYNLLHAKVPEKWKKLADDRMREIIWAEREGRAQPRREWEVAFPAYLGILRLCLHSERFPYSLNLFASQVEFVLELPDTAGKELFPNYSAHAILKLLPGEGRQELRHRFARHMVLADHGPHGAFGVYSKETRAGAAMMLQEFGDADPELAARLRKAIAEGDKKGRRERAAASKEKERKTIVMEQMLR